MSTPKLTVSIANNHSRPSSPQPPSTPKRLKDIIPQLNTNRSVSPETRGNEQGAAKMLSDVLEQLSPAGRTSPSPRRSAIPIGEKIIEGLEDYKMLKTIGEGSFGKVKLALHLPTGERVAIKSLSKSALQTNVGTSERVVREILILTHLSHPNIVRLLQVIDTSETIYLVLEYECGGDLFDFTVAQKDGRLEEKKARQFFRGMISAIQYCHACGVAHRDLKPENILLSSTGTPKLTDYGFSTLLRPDTLLETFCGSAAYAAPEMIGQKPYAGTEVDIWSMGVILFVLVTGQLPFDDPNVRKMYAAIMGGKYTFPDFISEDCKDLIRRILKVRPGDRAKLSEIRDHAWMTHRGTIPPLQFYEPAESGVVSPFEEEEIDEGVLEELAELGYHTDEVSHAINRGDVGHLTAAYWLLKGKKERSRKSGWDINEVLSDVSPARNERPPAIVTTGDCGTAAQQQKIDSAVAFTPRSANKSELDFASYLPPQVGGKTPGSQQYTHATTGNNGAVSLIAKLRAAQTPSPTSVPEPSSRLLTIPTQKPAQLTARTLIDSLTNHPLIAIVSEPETTSGPYKCKYTCPVTNQAQPTGTILEASSPEEAMAMIIGELEGEEEKKCEFWIDVVEGMVSIRGLSAKDKSIENVIVGIVSEGLV